MSIETDWTARLVELCDALRTAARGAIARADASGDLRSVADPVRQGAGDVTYAIDDVTEREVDAWLERTAGERPLSLMTEDSGWRHRGPDGRGGSSPASTTAARASRSTRSTARAT
jgi:hypothetical protein